MGKILKELFTKEDISVIKYKVQDMVLNIHQRMQLNHKILFHFH